ncbi:MAG: LysR family transcriptional regulator [Albidovulum sp.]
MANSSRPNNPGHHFSRDLDWNLLKRFHQITSAGNVTKAAQEVNRKQPALSLALKRLEDRLGVVLCDRGPGGFRLSDEGRIVAELCQQLESSIREIPARLSQMEEEVRGLLRIMMVSNIAFSRLDETITRFHQKYPAVEIVVEVAAWTDIVNAVLQRKVDIGIAPVEVKRAELDYAYLFTEVHRPYCGAGHRLFGHRYSDPKDLADEAFVLTGADEGHELTRYRLEHGLGSNVAGVSAYLDEAKRLATLGVGLCFLPEGYAQPDVDLGRLWPLISGKNTPSSTLYVLTYPKAEHKAARDLFLADLSDGRSGVR